LRSSVADYEVIEELPAGGGRTSYLCRPPARLRVSEPSVMVSELAVDAAGWRDLADALTRISAIDSEHLLSLIEVGPDLDPSAAGVYLASEAPTGGTLVKPTQALDAAAKVRAVAQIALGAHALHEGGVAHGSISAESTWFTDRGAALGPPPLDTPPGLVTKVGGWHQLVTVDRDLLGGEGPSRASDVWAIGATLHAALSDRPIYPGIDGDEPVTAVQRIVFGQAEVDPDLPAGLAEVIVACLDHDPAARPVTAKEVADRLLTHQVER
jgi:serine/threonine protein kinase